MASFPSPDEIAEACAAIPGSNVLEVSPENAWSYACGSWQLVQRDLERVLPEAAAQEVQEFLHRVEVPEAFSIRGELVNFKKVMLYIHEQGTSLERSLAQLNTFLNYDATSRRDDDYWAPPPWSGDLLDSHMQCKGRCMATADIRRLCKEICCLPRHPSEAWGTALQALDQLPASLQTWGTATAAAATVAAGAGAREQEDVAEVVREVRAEKERKRKAPLACTQWQQQALEGLESQAWPPHAKALVRAVLASRGADKALRIREQLERLTQALEATLTEAEAALAVLQGFPSLADAVASAEAAPLADAELREAAAQAAVNHSEGCTRGDSTCPRKLAVQAATWRQRHVNLLSGAVPPLREGLRWLKALQRPGEQSGSLFIAGDAAKRGETPPTLCVPEGFEGCKALDAGFKAVLARHKPRISSGCAGS